MNPTKVANLIAALGLCVGVAALAVAIFGSPILAVILTALLAASVVPAWVVGR